MSAPQGAPGWRELRAHRIARQQQEQSTRRNARSRPRGHGEKEEQEEETQKKPTKGSTWALAVALLAFGGIGWVLGGMFTFDGWITWVNGVFAIVRLPIEIPAATGIARLLFIPLAIAYSRVEVKHRPVWRDKQGDLHFEAPLYWIGFLLITLTDIGSTVVGVQLINPAQWGALRPFLIWILQDSLRIDAAATILTFVPEWLIMGGLWFIKR